RSASRDGRARGNVENDVLPSPSGRQYLLAADSQTVADDRCGSVSHPVFVHNFHFSPRPSVEGDQRTLQGFRLRVPQSPLPDSILRTPRLPLSSCGYCRRSCHLDEPRHESVSQLPWERLDWQLWPDRKG